MGSERMQSSFEPFLDVSSQGTVTLGEVFLVQNRFPKVERMVHLKMAFWKGMSGHSQQKEFPSILGFELFNLGPFSQGFDRVDSTSTVFY